MVKKKKKKYDTPTIRPYWIRVNSLQIEKIRCLCGTTEQFFVANTNWSCIAMSLSKMLLVLSRTLREY